MPINIDSEPHNADWIRTQAARHKWEAPDTDAPAIMEQSQPEQAKDVSEDENA